MYTNPQHIAPAYLDRTSCRKHSRNSNDSLHNDKSDDDRFIQSLARGILVLQAFSNKWKHLSMAQISHLTGIPRASVDRCLHTLWKLGYVGIDKKRRYFLLPKIMHLGHIYTSSNHLLAMTQPHLDQLAEKTGEACSLAVLDGNEIIYLARGLSSRIMSLELNIGSRVPLYCSAIGLLALSCFDETALDSYIDATRFLPYTNHTITEPDQLRTVLKTIKAQGYVISSKQRDIRFDIMATPIRNEHGIVLGGVNIIVKSGTTSINELPGKFLKELQHTTHSLETLFSKIQQL